VRSRTLDIAPSAARICVRAAHDAACAARPGVGARAARLQLLTASASVVHGRSDRPARRSRELLGAWLRGGEGDGGVTHWAHRWRLERKPNLLGRDLGTVQSVGTGGEQERVVEGEACRGAVQVVSHAELAGVSAVVRHALETESRLSR